METKKSKIIFILVLIIIGGIYTTININAQFLNQDLKEQVNSLQDSIKKNQMILESYGKTIQTMEHSFTKLKNKIDVHNKEIEKLNKKYNEKFDTITTFYPFELQEYVSKRYKDK